MLSLDLANQSLISAKKKGLQEEMPSSAACFGGKKTAVGFDTNDQAGESV